MNNDLFASYPDVVTVDELCEMLGGIGIKSAYNLLHSGKIRYLRIGRTFRIPKSSVVRFIESGSSF